MFVGTLGADSQSVGDLIRNTGTGNPATHQCAKELGLTGTQAHHDAANLVDRVAEQQANGGLENRANPPLFSPELGHNGMNPDHRQDMRAMMKCGLEKHGYGSDMVGIFNQMYDDAIGHEQFTHAMGNSKH